MAKFIGGVVLGLVLGISATGWAAGVFEMKEAAN